MIHSICTIVKIYNYTPMYSNYNHIPTISDNKKLSNFRDNIKEKPILYNICIKIFSKQILTFLEGGGEGAISPAEKCFLRKFQVDIVMCWFLFNISPDDGQVFIV